MNTRKAGEDFYFIHKMPPIGGMGEINNTCVCPSDRVSERVPFGTGHAIQKFLNQNHQDYLTYNPRIFVEIKRFIQSIPFLHEVNTFYEVGFSEPLISFLEDQNFQNDLEKMQKNSSTVENFIKNFYRWFDGFRMLKLVHFLRDEYYPNIDLVDALGWLHHEYVKVPHFGGTKEEKLMILREWDRETNFYFK